MLGSLTETTMDAKLAGAADTPQAEIRRVEASLIAEMRALHDDKIHHMHTVFGRVHDDLQAIADDLALLHAKVDSLLR